MTPQGHSDSEGRPRFPGELHLVDGWAGEAWARPRPDDGITPSDVVAVLHFNPEDAGRDHVWLHRPEAEALRDWLTEALG